MTADHLLLDDWHPAALARFAVVRQTTGDLGSVMIDDIDDSIARCEFKGGPRRRIDPVPAGRPP